MNPPADSTHHPLPTSNLPTKAKRQSRFPLPIIFLALLASVVAGFLANGGRNTAPVEANRVDWSAGVQKIRSELKRLGSEAEKAEGEVWRDFEMHWKASRAAGEKKIRQALMQSVDSLVTTGEIGGLVKDFAMDKVSGGDRAWERLSQHSQGFSDSLAALAAEGTSAVERASQKLSEVNGRYALRVGAVIDANREVLPPQTYDGLTHLQGELPRQCAIEVGATGTAVALEAVCAGATRQSLRAVLEWLAGALAPEIATGAIAAGTVEIPVADVVSVILAGWTVYDVIQLPGKIRGDVKELFTHAMNTQLTELDAAMTAATAKLAQQSRAARESAAQRFLAIAR